MTAPQPAQQEQGTDATAGKKTSKLAPFVALVAVGGIVLTAFVIGLAIAFSFIKWREPAPDMTAFANGLHCDSWDDAYIGYQDKITSAANEFKIPPALLGAIFLSEHGQSWPQRDMSGTWDTEGNIQGPFQFDTSDTGSWNGLVANQSTFKGYSVDSFEQSVRVAAFYLKGIIDTPKPKWDASKLTDDQIRCVAAGFNKGGSVCADWIGKGFSGDPVGVDLEYDKRALKSYKDLNVGCQSYTGTLALTPEGMVKVPGLDQRDPDWQDNSIYHGGCDLTSAAMVARAFGGVTVTPMDVRAKGGSRSYMRNNEYYSTENWTVLPGEEFPAKKIADYIKNKQPVVMRFRNYTATYWKTGKVKTGQTNGHYVVIVGISDDGKTIFVQDPYPWLEVGQPPKNGNPPIPRSADPSKYGINTDGVSKFEFWAAKAK